MARKGKASSIRYKRNKRYRKDTSGKTNAPKQSEPKTMYKRRYKIVNGIKYSILE